MDLPAIAKTLDEIARRFRYLQLGEVEFDDSEWQEYENLVEDLENLSDDLEIEEADRLAHIGCGGQAFCLFCGEKFIHGAPHPCPQLLLRGDSREREGTV